MAEEGMPVCRWKKPEDACAEHPQVHSLSPDFFMLKAICPAPYLRVWSDQRNLKKFSVFNFNYRLAQC
jgi:hypothetical protein